MASTLNQIPVGMPIAESDGRVTNAWWGWFNQLETLQNNVTTIVDGNYLTNGSYSTIGSLTVYVGNDSDRAATPTDGELYFAIDTGIIYSGVSGSWYPQLPAFDGDVYNTTGSNILTLQSVNSTPGTYTNPQLTVNAKGLVTAISSGLGPTAAGSDNDVQFNEGGLFTADTGFFEYNPTTHVLDATNPTKNLIDRAVYVPVDTSYTVSSYLDVSDVLTVDGIVTVLGSDTLGNSGVTAGSYTLANITVNSEGLITAASTTYQSSLPFLPLTGGTLYNSTNPVLTVKNDFGSDAIQIIRTDNPAQSIELNGSGITLNGGSNIINGNTTITNYTVSTNQFITTNGIRIAQTSDTSDFNNTKITRLATDITDGTAAVNTATLSGAIGIAIWSEVNNSPTDGQVYTYSPSQPTGYTVNTVIFAINNPTLLSSYTINLGGLGGAGQVIYVYFLNGCSSFTMQTNRRVFCSGITCPVALAVAFSAVQPSFDGSDYATPIRLF